MTAAKESTRMAALRRQFEAGNTVYVLEFAETYGIGAALVNSLCRSLELKNVCKWGGTYHVFPSSKKGFLKTYNYFVPKVMPTPPATVAPAAIDIDEQPIGNDGRVDMTHPNVIMMEMYL